MSEAAQLTVGLKLQTMLVAWPPGGTPGPRVRRSLPSLRRSSSRRPGLFRPQQPGSLTLDVSFLETNSEVFQQDPATLSFPPSASLDPLDCRVCGGESPTWLLVSSCPPWTVGSS